MTTTTALHERAEELRAILARPSERERAQEELDALEVRIAAVEEEAARAEAEKRLVGIARAFGSLSHELDEDTAKAVIALDDARARLQRINERFTKLAQLRAEVVEIKARHPGITTPTLPPITAPSRRGVRTNLPVLLDHTPVFVRAMERRRRAEAREAARQRQHARGRRPDDVLEAAVAEAAAIPPSVPAARARVHRG